MIYRRMDDLLAQTIYSRMKEHQETNPALPDEPVPKPETPKPQLPDVPTPEPDEPKPPLPQHPTPPFDPTQPEPTIPAPVTIPPETGPLFLSR